MLETAICATRAGRPRHPWRTSPRWVAQLHRSVIAWKTRLRFKESPVTCSGMILKGPSTSLMRTLVFYKSVQKLSPGTQMFVRRWPAGPLLKVLGHYVTCFWGPGNSDCMLLGTFLN